jgi:hypothetical protein
MSNDVRSPLPVRIASVQLNSVASTQDDRGDYSCRLLVRMPEGTDSQLVGNGDTEVNAIAQAVGQICIKPLEVTHLEVRKTAAEYESSKTDTLARTQCVVAISDGSREGAGRASASSASVGLAIAMLRAANSAGMLNRDGRANNQKVLRDLAGELVDEIDQVRTEPTSPELQRLETEGLVLEAFNRVASAAVITAANHPKPNSILQLFDTSAWLYDRDGTRRDAYTETNLWLAWYPGLENDSVTVEEVIQSMPAAPEAAIPNIVRMFENPTSWLRFRGAINLEDHDVLHVLLGRGLQDQDEAFVLGFAMGTSKKKNWLETAAFKFVLARVYPEPYRIPNFLQPAFDLGVLCGRKTGAKDLYKRSLKELRSLSVAEARRQAGIDVKVVREHYEAEQQQIPFTIASLRLP